MVLIHLGIAVPGHFQWKSRAFRSKGKLLMPYKLKLLYYIYNEFDKNSIEKEYDTKHIENVTLKYYK